MILNLTLAIAVLGATVWALWVTAELRQTRAERDAERKEGDRLQNLAHDLTAQTVDQARRYEAVIAGQKHALAQAEKIIAADPKAALAQLQQLLRGQ